MVGLLLWLGIFPLFWGGSAETINFDAYRPGAPPPGWNIATTHDGAAPRWTIVQDNTAPSKPNVLAQLSSARGPNRFPLAIVQQESFRDGEVSVHFKPVSGSEDQAAGLVWRYRDPNNYYVARANAIEDNVVAYKVEGGNRTPLVPKGKPAGTYGMRHDIAAGVWNTLHVKFHGTRFIVYYDHVELFEVQDSTFTGPGHIGLWTKADSITYFDDLQIRRAD